MWKVAVGFAVLSWGTNSVAGVPQGWHVVVQPWGRQTSLKLWRLGQQIPDYLKLNFPELSLYKLGETLSWPGGAYSCGGATAWLLDLYVKAVASTSPQLSSSVSSPAGAAGGGARGRQHLWGHSNVWFLFHLHFLMEDREIQGSTCLCGAPGPNPRLHRPAGAVWGQAFTGCVSFVSTCGAV